MKSVRKFNVPVLVIALSMLFAGTTIIYRGAIWNVALGDKKYFVGAVAILAGLYFLFSALKKTKQ